MTHGRGAENTTVVAVRYGELHTRRSEVFLDDSALSEADGPILLAYYFWVIRSGARTIVVDTGFDPVVGTRRGRTTHVPPTQAFEMLGIERNDAVDVILTHAHYDHIGNAAWFTNARFFIAAAEHDFWSSRASQSEQFRHLVEATEVGHLDTLRAQGRLAYIDQVTQIAPGVDVLPAPGHTPGQLMVLIAGVPSILLTSDAVHFDEELDRDLPFRHMTDLVSAHHTYRRIRAMRDEGSVDVVVTGHDDAVMRRFPALPGPLSAHAVRISEAPAHQHVRSTQEEVSP